MDFIIERDRLLKSLARIQSVADKRNATPILSNVKIECQNSLNLTVADMEMSSNEELEIHQIIRSGETTVSVEFLYDIVRKLSEETMVHISLDGSQLELKSGSSNFSLPTLPVSSFPNFGLGEVQNSLVIHSVPFQKILGRTKHATLIDDNRYYLCGCCLHIMEKDEKKLLCSVATDTHRLAIATCGLPDDVQSMNEIIIPRKFANEVNRLLDQYVGDVKVEVSKNRIMLSFGSMKMISRLIDGNFPDYKKVIPSSSAVSTIVNKKSLIAAIDLVISVSLDRHKTVELNILQPDLMQISASSDLRGNASGIQSIEIKGNTHNFKIIFNARYLMDILNVLEGEEVRILMNEQVGPTIFEDPADDSALYVLMPVQTS